MTYLNKTITCYFDGGCNPNPGGYGTYGIIIKVNNNEVWSESKYLGEGPHMSNNVAEYAGIIAVMKKLLEKGVRVATIYGDSKMVCRQLDGKMGVKAGLYVPMYHEAIKLRRLLPKVKIQHIRRHLNGEADRLAWKARPLKGKTTRAAKLTQLIREQKIDATRDKYGTRSVRIVRRDVIHEIDAAFEWAIS